VDRVSYNNDFRNVLKMCCLVDITSNSKEFSFHACDVNSIIKCFDNQFIVDMYMCD